MSEKQAKTERVPRSAVAGFCYVLGATLAWSAVPICVKFALDSVDAYTVCWIRFAVGALILLATTRIRGAAAPVRRHDARIVLIAAVGIGGNYLFYIRGLQDTTASAANVMVQFEVVWLVILSRLWLKERMSPAKTVGMSVTFAGVMLALWNGESLADLAASRNFFGNMLILVAAPLWAIFGIAQKILADRGLSISSSLVYIFSLASVVTLPAVIAGGEVHGPISASVAVSLFVLIAFGTVGAYLMIGRGFALLSASTAAVITCLLPIFTIVNARIFLNEPISVAVAAGALLVVAGIGVIGREEVTTAQL